MPTILIVDDEPGILENTREILSFAGHTIIVAEDGALGLEAARKHRPDLIISDIQMPVMDGYTMLQEIRRDPLTQSIPLIFLTARADRESQRKGMETGADDYLTKPFTANELESAVSARLKRHDSVMRRVEELNLLRRIDQELSFRLNPDWVIKIMMDWALRQTGAHIALMGTIEQESPTLLLRYVSGFWPDKTPEIGDRWPLDGVIGHIIRSEQPIYVADTEQESAFQPSHSDMKSVLGLPLATSEQRLGVILLESRKFNAFKVEDMVFLAQIANRAAMALGQANLFQMLLQQYQQEMDLREMFGRFVSREVAEAIRSGEINLAGEVQVVSVLFCDIRDFTAFSEDHTPQEVMQILNEYFPIVVESAERNGGMINKFGGDSAMLIFGVPTPLADSAYRAIVTALQIRRGLHDLNHKLADRGFNLRIGAGINTGEVIAGVVGSQERQEYTVIGDTVNLSARVESLNKQYGEHDIFITDYTYQALGDRRIAFEFVDLGEIAFKGKAHTVKIWAVADFAARAGL
ncbi:MAG: response regulator [Anaerolineae bacterium]|nr:response regulator [Anaerolineae bacterium]